ncbi:MAG: hypothetical protein HYS81_03090 [Candidatus Aenigmatarchaeota archaeon]|nr:MAG: hypothetical protein HYS81_03090 [Candidatus Aenigmarchaeota archaeon]
MADLVQIVFVEDPAALDRMRFLLRQHIPHKVYFLKATEEGELVKSGSVTRPQTNTPALIRKQLEKELPKWVADNSKTIEIPFFDMSRCLPQLVGIIHEERKQEREVYINIHGGSRILSTAAMIASAIAGAKVFWIEPAKWTLKKSGDYELRAPVGAKEAVEITVPITISVPQPPESRVLAYLHAKGGSITGNLSEMAKEIGLEHLGVAVKKPSSAVVKLSKICGRLKEKGLVQTRKLDRKSFQVVLTEEGKILAEISSIMED